MIELTIDDLELVSGAGLASQVVSGAANGATAGAAIGGGVGLAVGAASAGVAAGPAIIVGATAGGAIMTSQEIIIINNSHRKINIF